MAPSHKIQGNSRITMKLGEVHEGGAKFLMNPKYLFVTSFLTIRYNQYHLLTTTTAQQKRKYHFQTKKDLLFY